MKNLYTGRLIALFLCSLFLVQKSSGQSTGKIIRQATAAAGRTVLDPNSDTYTSATTAGYNGNDVANSEITFRAVPSFNAEPFGDLRRGPSHLYTDFVPDANNVGYYSQWFPVLKDIVCCWIQMESLGQAERMQILTFKLQLQAQMETRDLKLRLSWKPISG
jgi:hypothetical protein